MTDQEYADKVRRKFDNKKLIPHFLREAQITTAQADILRAAIAPYNSTPGRVNTYNVRSDSLKNLQDLGLIAMTYVVSNPDQRNEIHAQTDRYIHQSWETVKKTKDPYSMINENGDTLPAWKMVMTDLMAARDCTKKLAEKDLYITEKGRILALRWKELIGAEE